MRIVGVSSLLMVSLVACTRADPAPANCETSDAGGDETTAINDTAPDAETTLPACVPIRGEGAFGVEVAWELAYDDSRTPHAEQTRLGLYFPNGRAPGRQVWLASPSLRFPIRGSEVRDEGVQVTAGRIDESGNATFPFGDGRCNFMVSLRLEGDVITGRGVAPRPHDDVTT
jgi:hypothetical protein